MSKKVILIFEENDDYEKFAKEMRLIPEKIGIVEEENEEHLVVKIINLENK